MRFSSCLYKKLTFSIFLYLCLIFPGAAHANLSLSVSGASDTLSDGGLALRTGINYFLPGDLFELTVENTGSDDGDVLVAIHLRGDGNGSLAEREWMERWFIYNNIFPLASPTLSSNYTPQILSSLPNGKKITLLNFFVDEDVTLTYPVIFVGYLFDETGNIIGFDSRTVFFRAVKGF